MTACLWIPSSGEQRWLLAPIVRLPACWRWGFQHALGGQVSSYPPGHGCRGRRGRAPWRPSTCQAGPGLRWESALGSHHPPGLLPGFPSRAWPGCFWVCSFSLHWAGRDGKRDEMQHGREWGNLGACPLIKGLFFLHLGGRPRFGFLFAGKWSAIKATVYLIFSQWDAIDLLCGGTYAD